MNKLNPLTFALQGSRLIEASAGTGKTFTIAALYVRLVLGHGQADTAFNRPLVPPEILVVTFTEAATKELRSRIRERLAQAARYFYAGAADNAPDDTQAIEADDFLLELRQTYPAETWITHARRLQIAADWMDEAAVSTIHGWCNRMLREHAFHSESLFTQSLEQDPQTLLTEVVQDYWRQFIYPLDVVLAQLVIAYWATPQALLESVKKLLPYAQSRAQSQAPSHTQATALASSATPLDTLQSTYAQLHELKQTWKNWIHELRDLIENARSQKQFNGQKLSTKHAADWLNLLQAWCDDEGLLKPNLTSAAWNRFSPDGMIEIWHDKDNAPKHPALEGLAALPQQLQQIRVSLLKHATTWIAQRFEHEQNRRAQMGFDGLLKRLDAALQGDNGQPLAQIIRRQYPVALIDEFQDTDAIQYRIFDAVYRLNSHDPTTAVVLIGDPKQAIYTFRGADVYTYLQAKAAVQDRLYSLPTNYRSTQSMVEAVNHCFNTAENRLDSQGAFMFRHGPHNPVPFMAVGAQGRPQTLVCDGQPLPALNIWRIKPDTHENLTKEKYQQYSAAICAHEIAHLLQSGAQGTAGFQSTDCMTNPGSFQAIKPADIAILVNNRIEANAIRQALTQHHIRSVYLSEGESVYHRPQAQELRYWLLACADPENARAVRMALATPSLQLDWQTLDRFNHDALAWDAQLLQFKTYQTIWQQQGVLPMLRRLLHDFQVPARLLAQSQSGERSLTDLLHLAELLQQASTLLEGEQALITHLTAQINQESTANTPYTMRLESDADLVQVITIHKSKGLEYPLVWMPFICNTKTVDAKKPPFVYHNAQGEPVIELEAHEDIVLKADQERLAEDIRKLYVGLTRARYATWLGLAYTHEFANSAMGYLLDHRYQEGPDEWAHACSHIQIKDVSLSDGLTSTQPNPTAIKATIAPPTLVHSPQQGSARQATRNLNQNWWIASYSTMRYQAQFSGGAVEGVDADTLLQEVAAEESNTPLQVIASTAPAAPSLGLLHDFPRGAAAGVFLHDVLEWACAEGLGNWASTNLPHATWPPSVYQKVYQHLLKRCQLRRWEPWAEALTQWLLSYLQLPLRTPLGTCFTLGSLAAESMVAEMEFWLAVHHVNLQTLDAMVIAHTLNGLPRPALQPGQLHGMLKGFMDLVVEHEGCYYVIDYKSNHLGDSDWAYTPEAMMQVILDNRYELQYVLYLVALHRLLKLRLPDYDYDEHIGGAMYLFLRGHQAPTQGIHAERPPRALIEGLDALFTAPLERHSS